MVTRICYHGYQDLLPWLLGFVTMVTKICYQGYQDLFPWLPGFVTMVTRICFHGYQVSLPWLPGVVTTVTRCCYHGNKIQYKIQGQVSPLTGSPEVLISFSVTLSHSVASYLTSCRGVNPTSQGVCISSRSCTRYSLVTGRPAAAGNRTPVCCVGGENGNHYTTR